MKFSLKSTKDTPVKLVIGLLMGSVLAQFLTGSANAMQFQTQLSQASTVGDSLTLNSRLAANTESDTDETNMLGTDFSPVPTDSLTTPLACPSLGNIVNGSVSIPNTTGTPQTGHFTTVLPNQLKGLTGSCVANFGTCTIYAIANQKTNIVWTGTIPGNQTLAVTYQAEIVGETTNRTYCATTTTTFGNTGPVTQACFTVSCPAPGPGETYSAVSEASDQKAGSLLIYNIYTSGATSANTQNARINITNTHSNRASFVHLFFVAEGCSVADSYLCLTGNQTASFLASDLDPGTTGYIVAVAVNQFGCPVVHNFLIGDEYVKFSSGHSANLGAIAFSHSTGNQFADYADPLCDSSSVTALLEFSLGHYNMVPSVLALDNIGSRADGNDTMLIINCIGGNLGIGASTLGALFGIFYDDAENALSFSVSGSCQLRAGISNNFPRTTPRFETFIPAGRTGWLKVFSPERLVAMTGAAINFNPSAVSSAGAFTQGHNLHHLKLVFTSYEIPVFPPNC